ncbi:MAG: LuxR family transcriptional regulator [Verrucomicrobia bacterium]|nr:LuxR family transcriptional regulator [Verrucomicrobiota bacterium]
MTQSQQLTPSALKLRAFILEEREIFQYWIKKWLMDGGHQAVIFDNTESLKASPLARDIEMISSRLLPDQTHFRENGSGVRHLVYGENLDAPTIHWCHNLEDLLEGFHAVALCQVWRSPSVQKKMKEGANGGVSRLSRRENEVARLLVRGFSVKQVSSSLGTTEGTVKNQRKSVYRKLGIVRATQLASALGLVVPKS